MPSIYSETNVSRTTAIEDQHDDHDSDGETYVSHQRNEPEKHNYDSERGTFVYSLNDDQKNYSCSRELLWHDEINDDDYCLPLTSLLNQPHRESTVECQRDEQVGGGGDRLSPPVTRWSKTAVAEMIQRVTKRQHHHFLNKKRKPKFDVKHFRGTAMRAPSKRFLVHRRNDRASGHLMYIAKQGVGWFRTHEIPTDLDSLLDEARDSDLTGGFITMMNQYARNNGVDLSRTQLKGSGIPISHLTQLQRGVISKEVLQHFAKTLQHDIREPNGPHIMDVSVVSTSGFAKGRMPARISSTLR